MDIEETEPSLHDFVEHSPEPESLMEQLRARREEVTSNREVFLRVTGYEELGLQVKHRLIERKEIETIGKRVLQETKDRGERNQRILVDSIIQSTLGFYIQRPLDEEPFPLIDERSEEPITRWDHLAEYLAANNITNARSALNFVFGGNEFAIGSYGMKLNRWWVNTGVDVDAEFLGEGV